MSKLDLKDLKVGYEVYICDYRHKDDDVDKKPIRAVKPTKVKVVGNDELPLGRTVYYSDFHFRPFAKNGTVLKKVIAPYDNTGFRYRKGTCVNIFNNMKECIDCYMSQLIKIERNLENKRDNAVKYWQNKIDKVAELEFEAEKMMRILHC